MSAKRTAESLLALALVAGCAGRGPESPLAGVERDPEGLVSHIAALRGLENRRPARLVFHDEADFIEVLAVRVKRHRTAVESGDGHAFYRAFHLAALSGDDGAASLEDLQREQVLAFYDEEAHVVHIRRQRLGQGAQQEAIAVIAHEIGHSLQFQHFALPDLARIADTDTWLATMAVLEGDAMLSMVAYVAATQHVPLKRALVLVMRRAQARDFKQALRASGSSPRLLQAPPIVRERILFPYLNGTAFLAAIHRAGGFDLVDRVYGSLPTTTEQVLHPERYLAGEQPVLVPAPRAPAAHAIVAGGRMGELQTRVVLEQCLPPADARAAAAGWGGDAYTILESQRGQLTLLWSTVWDTEADAVEFEQALRVTVRCWNASGDAQRHPGDLAAVVRRDRTRVGLSWGLAQSPGVEAVERLLRSRLTRSAAKPALGRVRIPPVKPAVRVRPPYVANAVLVHERAGITLPILPGYAAHIRAGVFVMVEQVTLPATATMLVSEMMVTPASLTQVFNDFSSGFAQASGAGGELVQLQTGRIHTPLGSAVARTWSLGDGGGTLRVVVLPVCGNTGSLVFSQLWRSEQGHAQLDHWLGQLRPLRPGSPPLCAELDP